MVTVFLRSFIAPGFMLSVSPDEGLDIIFCDGPVSVHTQQDEILHHVHGEDHEIDGTVTHISPVCADWSTSGILAIMVPFVPIRFDTGHRVQNYSYKQVYYPDAIIQYRVIRAPPPLI